MCTSSKKLVKKKKKKEMPVVWLAPVGVHPPHVLGMRGGSWARAQGIVQRA